MKNTSTEGNKSQFRLKRRCDACWMLKWWQLVRRAVNDVPRIHSWLSFLRARRRRAWIIYDVMRYTFHWAAVERHAVGGLHISTRFSLFNRPLLNSCRVWQSNRDRGVRPQLAALYARSFSGSRRNVSLEAKTFTASAKNKALSATTITAAWCSCFSASTRCVFANLIGGEKNSLGAKKRLRSHSRCNCQYER